MQSVTPVKGERMARDRFSDYFFGGAGGGADEILQKKCAKAKSEPKRASCFFALFFVVFLFPFFF